MNYYNKDLYAKQRRKNTLNLIKRGLLKIRNEQNILIIFVLIVAIEIITFFYFKNKPVDLEGLELLSHNLIIIVMPFGMAMLNIAILLILGSPLFYGKMINSMMIAGVCNSLGEPPSLLKKTKVIDKEYGECEKYIFISEGIPLKDWQDRKEYLETSINKYIVEIRHGKRKNIIEITALSADTELKEYIEWDDKYINDNDAIYTVGISVPNRLIEYDTDKQPMAMVASSTGGGKTNLIKIQIRQAVLRKTKVYLIDKKRLVDYGEWFRNNCTVWTDDEEIKNGLKELLIEMNKRFEIIAKHNGANNIKELRERYNYDICRVLIVVDELGQLTDKTGLTKEEKECLDEICACLIKISQLGRAAGYHLLCGTQRPDMTIPGQLRSNFNIKIGGRCDDNLSKVIFGDNRGSDEIPKSIRGRFMLADENHTQFQGFYFRDDIDYDSQ